MDIVELAQQLAIELEKTGCLERIIRKVMVEADPRHQQPREKNSLAYSLRGDCLSLANKISEKHGIESRIIFGEMKKLTGVSQPEATEEQLSERVTILQRWLETGKLN